MANCDVPTIDSNTSTLRVAEEECLGVLPAAPVWDPLEPNSYSDFGGEPTTVARNPINASRQRKKGVVVDLDVSVGFNTDLTQQNLQKLLQGFVFADVRHKHDTYWNGITVSGADATDDSYAVSAALNVAADDLLYASGFVNNANNGLKHVVSTTANTVVVAEALTTEAVASGARLSRVGKLAAADDIAVVTPVGEYPRLTSVVLDFTTLGLIPGEWIFVGGDNALNRFTTAGNNGFKRIRSVSARELVFDKSGADMAAEAGAGIELQLFFGNVLKNEADRAKIKARSYQFERTLGSLDGLEPQQSEYVVGARASQLSLNVGLAGKMTADLTYLAIKDEQRTQADGYKAGDRPALEESDAFNTSSDVKRQNISLVDPADANPTPLYAFVTEMTLGINNSLSANKAVGVLGAISVSAGTFVVSGTTTAYFSDIRAVSAVRNNADVTLDWLVVKNNAGIVADIPLVTLGNGRVNVEQDRPITLPLTLDAATGAKIDKNLDHTLLFVFFNYLPDLASN